MNVLGPTEIGQKYEFTATMFNIGHVFPGFQEYPILLADGPRVFHPSSISRCNFRSPLTKTLDWGFETLDRECISTELCIHLASENMTNIAHDDPGLCITYLLSEI
jgi:hypothetical protein